MKKNYLLPLLLFLFLLGSCARPEPTPEIEITDEAYPTGDGVVAAVTPEDSYPVSADDSPEEPTDAVVIDPAYPVDESPEESETSDQPEGSDVPGSEPNPPVFDFPPTAQHHEFISEDGVLLTSTFYPPKYANAPVVVAFHQMGGSKDDWVDLALWMQNRTDEIGFTPSGWLASPVAQYAFFPQLPAEFSAAVLAIDFRNHGDSQSSATTFDAPGFLMDARAAIAYAKSLPGVNPDQVITMGGSIGADAAVDACLVLAGTEIASEQVSQGCVGIISFSPGNYLDVDYTAAVNRLAQAPLAPVNVYCLATEGDNPPATVCQQPAEGLYTSVVYPGSAHALRMIQSGLEPDIGELIRDFLFDVLEIQNP